MPDLYFSLIHTQDANTVVIALKFSLTFSLEHFVQTNQMDKYVEMRNSDLAFFHHFWSEADNAAKQDLQEGIQNIIQEYDRIGDTQFSLEIKKIIDS